MNQFLKDAGQSNVPCKDILDSVSEVAETANNNQI